MSKKAFKILKNFLKDREIQRYKAYHRMVPDIQGSKDPLRWFFRHPKYSLLKNKEKAVFRRSMKIRALLGKC